MNRILVVEDDIDVLEVVESLLSEHGYEVVTANSGKEIHEKVRFSQPDLILLDILLDDIDGRDVCRELKNKRETSSVPIIMMSSHPDIYQTIEECGANDVISKPFETLQLLLRVKRQLSQAQAIKSTERHETG